MSVYVYFKRRKEHGIFLANYELHATKPVVEAKEEKRIHCLEDGECIYGGRFHLSDDLTFIHANHYRISNVDGQPVEEKLESYTLPRYGA